MTNQTLQTLCQVLIAVGILFTAIGGWGSYYFGQRIERDKEAAKTYSGVLALKDEMLFAPSKQIYPKIEFGDSGAILMFTGQQGSPLFKFAEDNDITIEVEGGQVKVSTKIRDKKGHLIAEIQKNEWKVNPDKSWDRNYSIDALEVKDPSGDIVLQVRLLKDRVQLQAKLYDATGNGIGFGKKKGPNGWGGVIQQRKPQDTDPMLKIQPIFKYPSELHLGEFAADIKRGT